MQGYIEKKPRVGDFIDRIANNPYAPKGTFGSLFHAMLLDTPMEEVYGTGKNSRRRVKRTPSMHRGGILTEFENPLFLPSSHMPYTIDLLKGIGMRAIPRYIRDQYGLRVRGGIKDTFQFLRDTALEERMPLGFVGQKSSIRDEWISWILLQGHARVLYPASFYSFNHTKLRSWFQSHEKGTYEKELGEYMLDLLEDNGDVAGIYRRESPIAQRYRDLRIQRYKQKEYKSNTVKDGAVNFAQELKQFGVQDFLSYYGFDEETSSMEFVSDLERNNSYIHQLANHEMSNTTVQLYGFLQAYFYGWNTGVSVSLAEHGYNINPKLSGQQDSLPVGAIADFEEEWYQSVVSLSFRKYSEYKIQHWIKTNLFRLFPTGAKAMGIGKAEKQQYVKIALQALTNGIFLVDDLVKENKINSDVSDTSMKQYK